MEKSSYPGLPGSTPQPQVNGVTGPGEAIGSVSPRPIIDSAPDGLLGQTQGRRSIVQRRLQVPARSQTLLLGFKIPPFLITAGVTKEQWHTFTKEILDLINPHRKRQGTLYVALGFGLMLSPVAIAPITYLIRARHEERDRRRFDDMDSNGELKKITDRWNLAYFEPLGFHVKVDAPNSLLLPYPGCGNTADVDVASSKIFKYHQKLGLVGQPELDHRVNLRKERKYKAREREDQAIAAKRFSIVVWPLFLIPPEARILQQPLNF